MYFTLHLRRNLNNFNNLNNLKVEKWIVIIQTLKNLKKSRIDFQRVKTSNYILIHLYTYPLHPLYFYSLYNVRQKFV